jgi:hypothetical protein
MNKVQFIEQTFADRFEYHLPVPFNGFLNKSVFDGQFDLETPTREAFNLFLNEHGVSSFASRENSLLYYLIFKNLFPNNTCYLIYFDNEHATQMLSPVLQASKCEWRYSIEYMEGNDLCTLLGFQNPTGFLEAVNYSNRDLTNRYFYIVEINQADMAKYIKLYSSDVTNWSFIFCPEESKETVVQLFTDATQRPSLPQLLTHIDGLVNIQIGGDSGYLDYVLIQSKQQIDMVPLENTITTCGTLYETLLDEVNPVDEDWKVDFYKERFNGIFDGVR